MGENISNNSRFVVQWGILGTGNISKKFVHDLLVDPRTRNVEDLVHKVVAIGSRSELKAKEFIEKVLNCEDTNSKKRASLDGVKSYGSYLDLVSDSQVNVVYIGTPHTSHYQDIKLCLDFNKSVLCEKPITINSDQIKELSRLAKKKKLFLMEAIWTRFLPAVVALKKILDSNEIGHIERVDSDFSSYFDVEKVEESHRLINPDLGGGCLLDLGPYAWDMISLTLLNQSLKSSSGTQGEEFLKVPRIKASGTFYKRLNSSAPVDQSIISIIEFDNNLRDRNSQTSQGILSTSFNQDSNEEIGVTIYGKNGRINIESPICCPKKFQVIKFEKAGDDPNESRRLIKKNYSFEENFLGNLYGYFIYWEGWEADEVGRCLREKKIESEKMKINESVLMMEVEYHLL
ncbi:hypothetical protein PPACK8108_LOCUS14733 [Phakopsora pachyrhizi]|uniref:D-xylose 1-dehydrogenase (NADP(+), D-xylono-1,5-lactone-forming) n=1 Tax=Phakopsora pachyrhizi TaxID=170000 RepID=A0AAV0B7Q0_PHAPC|nr:hypothetical protein PPACK8108_LOCUS14733 [Phakopsora pachyrhizi]